ncbi:MAG: DUF1670 domain-containing protein [Planctomycetota bacterium]|jgi:hypothetical protein
MSIRNAKQEELRRLESKTLDAQFKTAVQEGLNCSPFESEAVLGVVREVYLPFWEPSAKKFPPGRISLVAICADEPAGKPVSDCQTCSVCLSVHRGPEDDRLMQSGGLAAFRQARIVDLCQEAMSQGALLTREDLAYRIFFVSTRTISRDLETLRRTQPDVPIPLRSVLHDIGPVLTHRVRIVRLALEGLTMSEIRGRCRHSPTAIANYVSTFTRCAQLAKRDMQPGQIAFLLRRSRKLVEEYIELLHECESDKNMTYHLDELMCLGRVRGKKNGGGRHVGRA